MPRSLQWHWSGSASASSSPTCKYRSIDRSHSCKSTRRARTSLHCRILIQATALNWFDYQNYYKTQYRIIRSKALAEKVLFKLKLHDKPPFKGSKDSAALFVSHVSVIPLPDTRLAEVAISHQDPKVATEWANTLAEAYLEQNLEAKIETTRNIYGWLQERLTSAQQDVHQSEEKLYEYSEKQDLFIPDEGQSIVSGTLEKLNEAYTDAKTRRIELESMLSQIRTLKRQGKSLESLPQVTNDALEKNLNMQRAGLEIELVQLRNRYKEGHPKVKKLRTQVEQLQEAIDSQAEKIAVGIQGEYQQIRRREQELLASVNEHRKESFQEGRKAVQMEMLQRDAMSNKNLYEVILQKIKETDVAASLWDNNVSIVEEAVVPGGPHQSRPEEESVFGADGRTRPGVWDSFAPRLSRQHAQGARGHRNASPYRLPIHGADPRGLRRGRRNRVLSDAADCPPL